jgi:transposase
VEEPATRFPSLGHGPLLLPSLASGWDLAENPRRFARAGTHRNRGARGYSERRYHRLSKREDHRKRGPRGYDAGKQIKGRKRHIVVDTLGLILAVVVHSAGIQDRDGAKLLLGRLLGRFPRLKLIWADGAYGGELVEWVRMFFGWVLEIVKRPKEQKGFVVLPRRWIVERTLGWLLRYRRLSKDYEERPASEEAIILIAMINLMVHRLEPD